MNFIKELLADSMNGFVLADIPFMVFRVLMAGIIGYVLSLLLKRFGSNESNAFVFPVLAMFMAVLSLVVQYSVPLAIVSLPLILLLNPTIKETSTPHRVLLIIAIGSGIACGAGSVFVTLLGLILILPILLLYKPRQ